MAKGSVPWCFLNTDYKARLLPAIPSSKTLLTGSSRNLFGYTIMVIKQSATIVVDVVNGRYDSKNCNHILITNISSNTYSLRAEGVSGELSFYTFTECCSRTDAL